MTKDAGNHLPKARKDQLIVKELDNETLVYDLKSDKAHCLNSTAALVWKYCDGERTVSEITHSLEQETNVPADEGIVWLALDQLKNFQLLDRVPSKPVALAGMSRRQLIRALGVAGIALPVVVSIVSPIAVQAQSCGAPTNRPNGCACTASGQCTSGCCRPNNQCDTVNPSCLP